MSNNNYNKSVKQPKDEDPKAQKTIGIGLIPGESIESYLGRKKTELNGIPPDPLPEWPDGMSAIMNVLARSATFSPFKKGDREVLNKEKIVAQNGYEIEVSGPRLDEGDRDVYLEAIRLYGGLTPGTNVKVSIKSFLRAIERSVGKTNKTWLIESLKRIADLRLDIRFSLSRMAGRYIGALLTVVTSENPDTEGDDVYFSFPTDLMQHLIKDYTYIPLSRRFALKGSGSQLAKWLQTYIYSHKVPFPVKVETLKDLSGSKMKRLAHFRPRLRDALDLLQENGDLAGWDIDPDTDLVHIKRKNDT